MIKHKTSQFKLFLWACCISVFFASCEKPVGVQFHNKTGYDIHELLIQGKKVGFLPKDESSTVIEYDGLWAQEGQLELFAHGHIQHQNIEEYYKCAHGYRRKKVRSGLFDVSIQLVEIDSMKILKCTTLPIIIEDDWCLTR